MHINSRSCSQTPPCYTVSTAAQKGQTKHLLYRGPLMYLHFLKTIVVLQHNSKTMVTSAAEYKTLGTSVEHLLQLKNCSHGRHRPQA